MLEVDGDFADGGIAHDGLRLSGETSFALTARQLRYSKTRDNLPSCSSSQLQLKSCSPRNWNRSHGSSWLFASENLCALSRRPMRLVSSARNSWRTGGSSSTVESACTLYKAFLPD